MCVCVMYLFPVVYIKDFYVVDKCLINVKLDCIGIWNYDRMPFLTDILTIIIWHPVDDPEMKYL